MILHCAKFKLDLTYPKVMGILNVTPDSFSDGGQFSQIDQALHRAEQLTAEGADIVDIGGESTRPSAQPVALEEELNRVIPVIEALSTRIDVPISIDTYKPAVMQAAIAAGASIVNDVKALQMPGALDIVAASDVGLCLMHMQGNPQTMQEAPKYADVVADVSAFLSQRVLACLNRGIDKSRIAVDPGFGFGKTREHNIVLLQSLHKLLGLDLPILVGLSRKSVLGKMTGNAVDSRLYASVAAAVIAAMKGANILRVHDVAATVEALKVTRAVME